MKKILSKLLGGVLLFNLSMSLTSCDPYLDDILGEWSRPTPGGNVTPGGGSSSDEPTPTMKATPLTVEAITAGTITVTNPKSNMKFSKNGATKTNVGIGSISVAAGDKVEFYGTDACYGNSSSGSCTKIGGADDGGTFKCKVYGNIMSLLYEDFATNYTTLPADYTFRALFKENTKLTDASGLLLPATTLKAYCYWDMFSGCTGLTTVPEKLLPATDLKDGCYINMFLDCKGLTTAPELPATTLTNSCYGGMFSGCSKLIATPHLAAETLVDKCYQGMFQGCTSLTKAYVKAAYTITGLECDNMFTGCSASGDLYTDGATSGTPSWANASVVSAWTMHAYE